MAAMGEQARHDLANRLAVLAARAGLRDLQSRQAATSAGVVLVVEDEPVLRDLVREGLAARGWTAIAAAHAEDALGLAAAPGQRVDALVTDVVMPRTSGRALAERLRRLLPRLRVVFVSGHPLESALVPAVDDSTAFLQKPFTLDQLDCTLRALLASA
jgi:DNA-binding response OmpR family regulator